MSAVPPLSLDDLTFEDLRLMAQRRIPAASGGRWTHHAPVDAGVTCLELFAFLLEQQLFVLDQVPDSLTHAILALLGETPQATRVTRTAVALERNTLHTAERLPAGTTLRPVDGLAELVFSLRDDAFLLPVVALDVLADGLSIADRLERGEPVAILPTTGASATLTADLRLAEPIRAGDTGARLAIAIVLEGTGVAPEWDADAADVPPPAPLMLDWATAGASGRLAQWRDGTGGLRRSGLVTFELPAETVGADRLSVTIAVEAVGHAEPLRLKALAPCVALVEHRRRVEIQPRATGDPWHDAVRTELLAAIAKLLPNSGQTLDLPRALAPVIESTLALRLADSAGDLRDWKPVADLIAAAPEDRSFTFSRSLGRLSFGDGYAGRVPAPATEIALVVDLGGGSEGDHPAGMRWRLRDRVSDATFVSLAAGEGGAEPESLAEARTRVARAQAERHRAVTAADYVTLVESTPGIGPLRAHVVAGYDPAFPCVFLEDTVTVFVVPRTGPEAAAPRIDDGALGVVRRRLDQARLLTTRVVVARALFRPVALTLEIAALTADGQTVTDLLRAVFSAYLHPALGGAAGTGWDFGRPLRPSELLRVAETALPPEMRVHRVAIRLTDTDGAAEDCTEVAIGRTELVRLDTLAVRLRREQPAEATL